jgi:hypothetical protein
MGGDLTLLMSAYNSCWRKAELSLNLQSRNVSLRYFGLLLEMISFRLRPLESQPMRRDGDPSEARIGVASHGLSSNSEYKSAK